jgi:acyl-[acyl-carrier-protein]-phospholipid O-acyltransferase/long-chain-fatty-acid--[acyl-carrier-protein] ligase
MEGYGATELSPVAGLNIRNVEAGGVAQIGHRPGTIGRPIPGVAMRVVDPEDFEKDLGYDTEGMLVVKGPNVMKGYLGRPDLTRDVIQDGWYITGDMARISHDGFVELTGRLSRFSKIGGEMVPHIAIEEKIQEILEKTEPVCAVSSVPDPKRGERIVVMLTDEAGDPDQLHKALRNSDLPNLYVPSRKDFYRIDEIPMLGSGKLDLKAVNNLAKELAG